MMQAGFFRSAPAVESKSSFRSRSGSLAGNWSCLLTAPRMVGQRVALCLYFPAAVDELHDRAVLRTAFSMTESAPLVGFFMPIGTSMPLATRRCCWFSTERADCNIGHNVGKVGQVLSGIASVCGREAGFF